MYEVFADLHVHIGRSENGKPIKITAARSLNFANIAKECAERKGINIVGIIDCASPYVVEDIEKFLKTGDAYELEDGGIIYKDKVCILLGSEVETSEKGRNGKCGAAHNVCFFPHLKDIKGFSNEMSKHIKNITLSTQRSDISGYDLIDIVEKYNGILIPAHIFTPFKSYYGNCTDRLQYIFKEKYDKIFAVELGLSSDTFLADMISELENKTFVTNSDAHSLPKIAREYNKMLVNDISFKEVVKALKNEDGRKILANYGLDPKLGKYHRTHCDNCDSTIETKEPVEICPKCGSDKVTFGVFDRIELIKDKEKTQSPANRPPYIYQIPLTFIPGVGGKTIEKLLDNFETEMNILHKLSEDDIEAVVGEKIAKNIVNAREGKMKVEEYKNLVEKKLVKFWETPAELGSVVSRSMVKLMKNFPAEGWVKAGSAVDEKSIKEIARLQKENEELRNKLEKVSTEAPAGTENLACGYDQINVSITFKAWNKDKGKWTKLKRELPFTWNRIFSLTAPAMLDETSEENLKGLLNNEIRNRSQEYITFYDKKTYEAFQNIEITDESMGQIQIQLRALGYIMLSEKKHTASDRSTYWTLTPYGNKIINQLLAIRKDV